MRVRLVKPSWGWWCEWVGKILCKTLHQVCDIDMDLQADPQADVNHWLTWHKIAGQRQTKCDVTSFTHLNVWDVFDRQKALERFDHLVAMSQHGRLELIRRGIDESKISVIYPGNDEFQPIIMKKPSPKIIIGISGAAYMTGRKRTWLPLELSWRTDLSRFAFALLGGLHWEEVAIALRTLGVAAKIYNKYKSWQYASLFPQLFDIYLCTGFREGGPMGTIQALGCGVPVISPDYGFAHDFKNHPGVIIYNSIDELIEILGDFEPFRVEPLRLSWQEWAAKHFELWKSLV